MTTQLSNRQFNLLRLFAQQTSSFQMRILEAKHIDQRAFRSLAIRGWVRWNGKGFKLTAEGAEAWEAFRQTSLERKNPAAPLSSYFDPSLFGLEVVKRRSHAA